LYGQPWLKCGLIELMEGLTVERRGARIHSDSWGAATAGYDDLAYDFDAFSYTYQDFLPVVAAGKFCVPTAAV
jgi:hypothetical protein